MQKIFPLKICSNSRGLSLIEIMIVLAIIGGVVSVGITRFRVNTSDYKKAVRNFRLLTKQVHSYAKLQNTTYRLVIDLARDEDRPEDQNYQSYWVEVSTEEGMVFEDDDDEEDRSDPDKPKVSAFKPAIKIMKNPIALPSGLEFQNVEIKGVDEPITRKKAYIYFSPQGLIDETVIHVFASEDFQWSIAIHPITGKADVFSKNISLKDLRNQ